MEILETALRESGREEQVTIDEVRRRCTRAKIPSACARLRGVLRILSDLTAVHVSDGYVHLSGDVVAAWEEHGARVGAGEDGPSELKEDYGSDSD